jgi:sarcosine oxidase, subunit gamma
MAATGSAGSVRLRELPFLTQVEIRVPGASASTSASDLPSGSGSASGSGLGLPLPAPGRASVAGDGALAGSASVAGDGALAGSASVAGDGALAGSASVAGDGPRYLLWLGPDWYLLVDDPEPESDREPDRESGLESGVDVSAQRTVLELSGPHAAAVLAHGCSLDLHPRSFVPGSCAQTMLAKAQVVLHQTGPLSYRILVRASYADYLVRWLLDAMVEYVSATGGADP